MKDCEKVYTKLESTYFETTKHQEVMKETNVNPRGLKQKSAGQMVDQMFLTRPPAHFHHVIELLRFRQGTLLGIFLSAGEDMESHDKIQEGAR